MTLATLAAALLASASPAPGSAAPAAVRPPAPVPQAPADADAPPPAASAEDRALWQQAHDVSIAIPVERHRATRLQAGARGSALAERLDALARSGSAASPRAAEIATGLGAAWSDVATTLAAPWPIDPRLVCRYPALMFANALAVDPGPTKATQVGEARLDGEQCLRRAVPAAGRMKALDDRLEGAIVEVETLLASAGVPVPAGAPVGN